jgi:hypothetical protein
MKRLLAIAILSVCSLPGALAQTAALPTVDQVLDKYVTALGGRAALEKLTSVVGKGTLELSDLQISGTIELTQKAPNKVLQVLTLTGVGVQREGFDGTIAWREDPQNGVREQTAGELADTRRGAMFPRELRLKQIYPTIAVTGRERVGERETIVVLGTPADGAPSHLYFDADSGLIVRQVSTRQSPEGPVQVDISFDDYRAVEGIKRAHTIRQKTPQYTAVVRLTEIKHNAPVDDAIFRKPG